MQKMVFGTVNKIFIAYEKPFLHPDITEVENVYFWPLPKLPQPPLSLKFLKPIIIMITTIIKVIKLEEKGMISENHSYADLFLSNKIF